MSAAASPSLIAQPGQPVTIVPGVEFVRERMRQDRRPAITFFGDLTECRFRTMASASVPSLLALLADSGGAYTHLMVNIRADYFRAHPDAAWQVAITSDGETLGRMMFEKHYAQHQVLIPSARLLAPSTTMQFAASQIDAAPPGDDIPEFTVEFIICSKEEIWNRLEQRSIWVFSTARSGSTWLALDVLCWRHRARPVDESGLGRMVAPLMWDAERFHGLAERVLGFESGLAFETGDVKRTAPGLPPFERSFVDLRREQQILNRMNFDTFHRMVREFALEHVLNEWGVLHYDRLVFKMPNDSHGADVLMRAMPGAHLVFLMRDGRDVIRSRFSRFASPILSSTADPALRRYAIAFYAHFWNFQVDIIRAAFDAHHPTRRILVRYEDIRTDPAPRLRELLRHLGMPLNEADLQAMVRDVTLENMPASERGPDKPRQSGAVGGYRPAFSAEEIALMESIMRENLIRYGYLEPRLHAA